MEIDSESENIIRQLNTIEIDICNSLATRKFTESIIEKRLSKLEDLISKIPKQDAHLIAKWTDRTMSLWARYVQASESNENVQNSANSNRIHENSTSNDLLSDISQKEICDKKVATSISLANRAIKRVEDEKSFTLIELTNDLRRFESEILRKLNSISLTKSNLAEAAKNRTFDEMKKEIEKFMKIVNQIPADCAQSQSEWFDRLDALLRKYDNVFDDQSKNHHSAAMKKQTDVPLDRTKFANCAISTQVLQKVHQSPTSKSFAGVDNFENMHKELNQLEADVLDAVYDETYCTWSIVHRKLIRLVEAIDLIPSDCVTLCDQWRKRLENIFEICTNLQKSYEKHLRFPSIDDDDDEQNRRNDKNDRNERRQIEKLEIEMGTLEIVIVRMLHRGRLANVDEMMKRLSKAIERIPARCVELHERWSFKKRILLEEEANISISKSFPTIHPKASAAVAGAASPRSSASTRFTRSLLHASSFQREEEEAKFGLHLLGENANLTRTKARAQTNARINFGGLLSKTRYALNQLKASIEQMFCREPTPPLDVIEREIAQLVDEISNIPRAHTEKIAVWKERVAKYAEKLRSMQIAMAPDSGAMLDQQQQPQANAKNDDDDQSGEIVKKSSSSSSEQWYETIGDFCTSDGSKLKQKNLIDRNEMSANRLREQQQQEQQDQKQPNETIGQLRLELSRIEQRILEMLHVRTKPIEPMQSLLTELSIAAQRIPADCFAMLEEWSAKIVKFMRQIDEIGGDSGGGGDDGGDRKISQFDENDRNDDEANRRNNAASTSDSARSLIEMPKYDNRSSSHSAPQLPHSIAAPVLSSWQAVSSKKISIVAMHRKLYSIYTVIVRLLQMRPPPLAALQRNIVAINREISQIPISSAQLKQQDTDDDDDTDSDDMRNRWTAKAAEVARAYQLAADGEIESLDTLLKTKNFDCDDSEIVAMQKQLENENFAAAGIGRNASTIAANFVADCTKSPLSANRGKSVTDEQIRYRALVSLSQIGRIEQPDDIPAMRRLVSALEAARDMACGDSCDSNDDYVRLQAELTAQALDKLPPSLCDAFCYRAVDRKNLASLLRFLGDHVGVEPKPPKYCLHCFTHGHTRLECPARVPNWSK